MHYFDSVRNYEKEHKASQNQFDTSLAKTGHCMNNSNLVKVNNKTGKELSNYVSLK